MKNYQGKYTHKERNKKTWNVPRGNNNVYFITKLNITMTTRLQYDYILETKTKD